MDERLLSAEKRSEQRVWDGTEPNFEPHTYKVQSEFLGNIFCQHLKVRHGLIVHNGLDVVQTRHYCGNK